MTAQTIDEAARMKRVPGIIFVDSAAGGRVARIAGTGLEVWEIIPEEVDEAVEDNNRCIEELKRTGPMLLTASR